MIVMMMIQFGWLSEIEKTTWEWRAEWEREREREREREGRLGARGISFCICWAGKCFGCVNWGCMSCAGRWSWGCMFCAGRWGWEFSAGRWGWRGIGCCFFKNVYPVVFQFFLSGWNIFALFFLPLFIWITTVPSPFQVKRYFHLLWLFLLIFVFLFWRRLNCCCCCHCCIKCYCRIGCYCCDFCCWWYLFSWGWFFLFPFYLDQSFTHLFCWGGPRYF